MIETIGDLLKLLHRYPSATRLEVGTDWELTGSISGEVLNVSTDGIILLIRLGKELAKKEKPAVLSDEAADAIDQCDHILTLCDDVPERAGDFATEIMEKVQSVRDWVEEHDHVTPKQSAALDGWERGIAKWVDRE